MFPKVTFRQTNAFAMQYGAVMGVWGLVANACFVGSFSMPGLSMLFLLLSVSSPVLAVFLTRRFRAHVAPQGPFLFHQAFLHTLLMGVYAAIWVAFGVYIYLAYFDHGYIFDAYLNSLNDPALQEQMQQLGVIRIIGIQRMEQALGCDPFLLIHIPLHGRQRIRRAGNAAAVQTEIVVLFAVPQQKIISFLSGPN